MNPDNGNEQAQVASDLAKADMFDAIGRFFVALTELAVVLRPWLQEEIDDIAAARRKK